MTPKFTTVRLRTKARVRLDKARRSLSGPSRKISLADTAEVLLDAFDSLSPEQRERIANGQPLEPSAAS